MVNLLHSEKIFQLVLQIAKWARWLSIVSFKDQMIRELSG